MTGPVENDIKDLKVTAADDNKILKLDYTVRYTGLNAKYKSLSTELKENVQDGGYFNTALVKHSKETSVEDVFSSATAGSITVSEKPTMVTGNDSSSLLPDATIVGLVIASIIAVVIAVLIARRTCCSSDSSTSRSTFSTAGIEISSRHNSRGSRLSDSHKGYSNVSVWDTDDAEESDLIGLEETTPKKGITLQRR